MIAPRASASRWRPSSHTLPGAIGVPVRAVKAAWRLSIRVRVRSLWTRSSGRNVASVANFPQVKQAFPRSQTCRGGSMHHPLGRIRSVRLSSWSMS